MRDGTGKKRRNKGFVDGVGPSGKRDKHGMGLLEEGKEGTIFDDGGHGRERRCRQRRRHVYEEVDKG